MNNYFSKIFIINLDSRPDRWEIMEKQMKDLNIDNYERFPAIKGDISKIDKNSCIDYNEKTDHYIASAYGCKQSHLKIIELAKERNYDNILILEDDCEFNDFSEEIFDRAIDELGYYEWDMLYLSVYFQKSDILKKCSYWNVLNSGLGAHSYAISKSVYGDILEKATAAPVEIDSFYKHYFKLVNAICITPHVCKQRAGHSDIKNEYADYNMKIEKKNIRYQGNKRVLVARVAKI